MIAGQGNFSSLIAGSLFAAVLSVAAATVDFSDMIDTAHSGVISFTSDSRVIAQFEGAPASSLRAFPDVPIPDFFPSGDTFSIHQEPSSLLEFSDNEETLKSSNADGPRAQLIRLHFLKNGWDGEDAPSPSREAIALAAIIFDTLLQKGLEPFEVDADVLGGVALWYESTDTYRRVWVACMNDGNSSVLFEQRRTGIHEALAHPLANAARIKQFLNEDFA